MKVKDLLLSAALGYIITTSVKWNMVSAEVTMGILLTIVIWNTLIKLDVYFKRISDKRKRCRLFI